MGQELDNIDLKILEQLQVDSNLTNKELAAAIHLSPTPTFERVKRLEREGYIKRYAAVLDAEKLSCGNKPACKMYLAVFAVIFKTDEYSAVVYAFNKRYRTRKIFHTPAPFVIQRIKRGNQNERYRNIAENLTE